IFGGDSTFALLDTALRDAVNKSLFQIAGRVIDIHSMAREREPDGDNSFEKLCARYLVGSTAAWRTDRLRFAELLARLTIRFESNSLVRAFAQQDKSENVTVESLEEFILETDSISRTCLRPAPGNSGQ